MMNSLAGMVLFMSTLMALAITLSAAPTTGEAESVSVAAENKATKPSSRLLLAEADRRRVPITTCNRYPRVCRARGSPGPDCCGKRCVNVSRDGLNCGMCGKKCKYSEVCCRGNCVNVLFSKRHCGRCNNRCDVGSSCHHGMCSYA